jgi:hypothetical protein
MRQRPEYPQAVLGTALSRSARFLPLAGLLLTACGSEGLTGPPESSGRAFIVQAGQQLEIRLQSIGPGEYRSPPSVSSPVISFQSVSLATPPVPAGLTQLFRFQAVAPGRAIVTFRHSEQSAPVIDTVDVR